MKAHYRLLNSSLGIIATFKNIVYNIQDRTIRKLLREGSIKARKLYFSDDSLKEYFSQAEADKLKKD
jgi:hypothetical protein